MLVVYTQSNKRSQLQVVCITVMIIQYGPIIEAKSMLTIA